MYDRLRHRFLEPEACAAVSGTGTKFLGSEFVGLCTIQSGDAIAPVANALCEVIWRMAKVIKFYVPGNFRPKLKWIAPKLRGKLIQFVALQKKSA
jgi:hypothetical protein